ncbi:hypothetical protein [Actinobacillus minor]|uniref:hypothetical protein n=1 Tax=Actinobacillus minor TaxID=51047 RepID=UPI0023F5371C|nr:hypothetical protein [Actinobacillus minor]MDD6911062.1 hypothetical protein [Actinobacillus minor]MDY4713738.1 hypothetical protein [Actinobacillus minor]
MSNKEIVKAMIESLNAYRFLELNHRRLVLTFFCEANVLKAEANMREALKLRKVKGVARCYAKCRKGKLILKVILSKKFEM